ncbi:hypothetical protein TWF281_007271 [Arthrobotrys megalospora]
MTDILQSDGKAVPRSILTIHGFRGVGKSELVSKYISENENKYSAVIWIRCADEASIFSSLDTIYNELIPYYADATISFACIPRLDPTKTGVSLETASICAQNIATILTKTCRQGWIVILDDLQIRRGESDCLKYLTGGSGQTIITKQMGRGSSKNSLELEGASNSMAFKIFSAKLRGTGRLVEPDDIQDLNKRLSGNILALEQAATYIYHNGGSIAQYISALDDNPAPLLRFKSEDSNNWFAPGNDEETTIWSAMDLTFKTLESKDPRAVRFLEVLAHMDSSGITRKMLKDAVASLFDTAQLDSVFLDLLKGAVDSTNIELSLTESWILLHSFSLISYSHERDSGHSKILLHPVARIWVFSNIPSTDRILYILFVAHILASIVPSIPHSHLNKSYTDFAEAKIFETAPDSPLLAFSAFDLLLERYSLAFKTRLDYERQMQFCMLRLQIATFSPKGGDPMKRLRLLREIGLTYLEMDKLEEGLDILETALEEGRIFLLGDDGIVQELDIRVGRLKLRLEKHDRQAESVRVARYDPQYVPPSTFYPREIKSGIYESRGQIAVDQEEINGSLISPDDERMFAIASGSSRRPYGANKYQEQVTIDLIVELLQGDDDEIMDFLAGSPDLTPITVDYETDILFTLLWCFSNPLTGARRRASQELSQDIPPPEALLLMAFSALVSSGIDLRIAPFSFKTRHRSMVNGYVGRTILHFAVETGHNMIVKLLLENADKLDVGAQDQYGETPLLGAVYGGNIPATKLLIRAGANPHYRNPQYDVPLLLQAIESDASPDLIQCLLESGLQDQINMTHLSCWTPLHLASHFGLLEVVQLLVNYGANPNAQNYVGFTPLTISALSYTSPNSGVIDYLLPRTDPNLRDAFGRHYSELYQKTCLKNPLTFCTMTRGKQKAETLAYYWQRSQQYRPDISGSYAPDFLDDILDYIGEYGLLAALFWRFTADQVFCPTCRRKIKTGIIMGMQDGTDPILQHACSSCPFPGAQYRHPSAKGPAQIPWIRGCTKFLNSANHIQVDSYIPVTMGYQFLAAYATSEPVYNEIWGYIKEGQREKIEKLIEDGFRSWVDPNDYTGFTMLHFAVVQGQDDIFILLADNGADINARDLAGWSVVHFIAAKGTSRLLEYVASKEADLNVQTSEEGWTPLHVAGMLGQEFVFNSLLIHQADRYKRDNKGELPRVNAPEYHRRSVSKLVKSQAAYPHPKKMGIVRGSLARLSVIGRSKLKSITRQSAKHHQN